MDITFNNAPLVEIIAELRWNRPQTGSQSQAGEAPISLQLTDSSRLEEFFMRFGGECYQQGFQRSERIVPANFPILPFQPVYRYKHANGKPTPLFQIGAGLFSANAIPPYKSWKEFFPDVSKGVAALIKARDGTEKSVPFGGLSLRYIDAFTVDFLQGRSANSFITDILGFSVGLPPVVSELLPEGSVATPAVQLSIPTKSGLVMTLGIGEGTVNGVQAVILDTTVAATTEVKPELNAVMETFNEARSVIHSMFVGITQPIHEAMQPRKSG